MDAEKILDALLSAAVWGATRAITLIFFSLIILAYNALMQDPQPTPLLVDATVSDLGRGLIMPMIVVFVFWSLLFGEYK